MIDDGDSILRVERTDPVTSCKGYVVINRSVNGRRRRLERARAGAALVEFERLTKTMTYKIESTGPVGEAANIGTDDGTLRHPHDEGMTVIPDFLASSGAYSWWWTMDGTIGLFSQDAFVHRGGAMCYKVTRLLLLVGEDRLLPREAAAHIAGVNLDRIVAEKAAAGRS